MGKSNIFDTVTASNTPQAFLERVNNTYTEYTRFAETQLKRSTRKDRLDCFLAGLPSPLCKVADKAPADIGVDHTSHAGPATPQCG